MLTYGHRGIAIPAHAASEIDAVACRFVHSARMRSRLSEARPRSFLIIEAATPILTASAITASTPHSAHFFLPKCVRHEQAAIPIAVCV
jgi:hypothetical protein